MDRLLFWSGLIVLAGLSGYTAGRVVTLRQWADPPFLLEPDLRPRVPVIQVEGVEEGEIVGRISGEARVFWGEEMIIPDGSGTFRIPSRMLLTEDVMVAIPDGMRFVASRRGKRYYPVASAMANRLALAYRVYFRSAEEAEAAGFLPP